MRQRFIQRAVGVVLVLLAGAGVAQARDAAYLTEQHLRNGDLAGGEVALKQRTDERPGDDQAKYGLGVIQLLQGVERLSQSLYSYGFGGGMAELERVPFLRVPMPKNENPSQLDYPSLRKIIEKLLDDVNTVDATLAQVYDPEVKLTLRLGLVRLDLDGDTIASEEETLWRLYAKHSMRSTVTKKAARGFKVGLDAGDVHWLRGKCHLVAALCELALAHDWQHLFETTGHLLFPKIESRYGFLTGDKKMARQGSVELMDIVTLFHLMRGRVIDRERMEKALVHLQAMIDQSLMSWKRIVNEQDNDNEWIPSSTQESVLPTIKISIGMIGAWETFATEARTVLSGTKLMPFWRGNEGDEMGVNLRKAFVESEWFDLILWLQGSALEPYLEKGGQVSDLSMEKTQRQFRGQFWSYILLF